jgi:predicted aldo/keto reductase-like oxidoreductase
MEIHKINYFKKLAFSTKMGYFEKYRKMAFGVKLKNIGISFHVKV